MPLNLADKNKIYIIQRIVGNKDMVHRLQSLGFVVGSKISVLSEINGNYVVVIKDIKIGLAKEYVKRIIVAWCKGENYV
ncbi:ferrous iron transport protein A [Lachnospira eligens]|jgi:ferrous iron transport protein A|nr:FeoA family protein [Lachnospira eligens]RGW91854.1 ferrous iron transport protein A [Lachnospira eligens]